jgi:hypothetical protein
MRVLGKVGMEVVSQHMAAGKSLGAIAALLNIETDALLTFVKQPENAARYEAARAERAVALVEQALDIVDAADAGDVRIVKLRVDTRKWLAAHLDPGRYGDGRCASAGVGVDAAHLDLLRRMAGGEDDVEN